MDFQIVALNAEKFRHLFGLSEEALQQVGAIRMRVNSKPGFPCRITLQDAEIGESVILLNYEHQPADSPYRSSHAIFIREDAESRPPVVNRIPESLSRRQLSIRSFTTEGMMIDAETIEGANSEPLIRKLLKDDDVAYLHVHNAKRGCFAARVERL